MNPYQHCKLSTNCTPTDCQCSCFGTDSSCCQARAYEEGRLAGLAEAKEVEPARELFAHEMCMAEDDQGKAICEKKVVMWDGPRGFCETHRTNKDGRGEGSG